uniref:Uncharacterized protein n=1 Tax=Arundo donax TaxID=35708 RepID=A0A0A9FDX9_ARUDO
MTPSSPDPTRTIPLWQNPRIMALKMARLGRGPRAAISTNTFQAARTSPPRNSRRSRAASAERLGVFPERRTRASTSRASPAMPAARNAWSARRSAPYLALALQLALLDQEKRSGEAAGRSAAMMSAAKGRSAGADAARHEAAAKRTASGTEEGQLGARTWSARWHCWDVLRRRASARMASRRREAGRERMRWCSNGRNCAVGW